MTIRRYRIVTNQGISTLLAQAFNCKLCDLVVIFASTSGWNMIQWKLLFFLEHGYALRSS